MNPIETTIKLFVEFQWLSIFTVILYKHYIEMRMKTFKRQSIYIGMLTALSLILFISKGLDGDDFQYHSFTILRSRKIHSDSVVYNELIMMNDKCSVEKHGRKTQIRKHFQVYCATSKLDSFIVMAKFKNVSSLLPLLLSYWKECVAPLRHRRAYHTLSLVV